MIHTVINARKKNSLEKKNANSELDLRLTYGTV